MWEWYEWESQSDFDEWHDQIKITLGLPIVSYNQATGEIDESAQWTENYTFSYQVGDKVIARVENIHSEGLTKTDLRYEPKID